MAKTPTKAAKASKAVPTSCVMPDRMHQSVSVRKIQNGYIVSKSQDGPKGYTSTEEFTPTKPKIEMQVTAGKTKR